MDAISQSANELPNDIPPKEADRCGLVMPISSIDGCTADHWSEVLKILKEVAEDAGYSTALVSDANEVGIIQKRIIQNLYSNQMIICDVSAKNPNVMFELGIRLAFDKPTIIVKDDKTDYIFDTAPIEHLEYPRDLRYTKILKFRSELKSKLIGTKAKFDQNPDASTFLKEFGEFQIARIGTKEVSSEQYYAVTLEEIRSELAAIRHSQRRSKDPDIDTASQLGIALHAIKANLDTAAAIKGIKRPYLEHEILEMEDELISIPSVRSKCGSYNIFRLALTALSKEVGQEIPF